MIYKCLISKAQEMEPIPDPDCYTFNLLNGLFRDYDEKPWFPFNPNYDPGPIVPVQLKPAAAAATASEGV